MTLAVDFAQEIFGGNAVFAARMDRDEKSLTNVDLFLAPRYIKETKHDSKDAISISKHLKILAEKYRLGPRKTDCWDSPQDRNKDQPTLRQQGSALQDALADFFLHRGYEARRGDPKETPTPDWMSPEMYGAKKDREVANALNQEAEGKLANANFLVAEAEQKLRAAEDLQHAAASEMQSAEQLRLEAKRDAEQAKSDMWSARTFNVVTQVLKEQADHQTAAAISKLNEVDAKQKLIAVERDAFENDRADFEKAKTEARKAAHEAEEAGRQAAELLAVGERALVEEQEALHRSIEQADARHHDLLKREKVLSAKELAFDDKQAALEIERNESASLINTIKERDAETLAALKKANKYKAKTLAIRHGVEAWIAGDIIEMSESAEGEIIVSFRKGAPVDHISKLITPALDEVSQFVSKENERLATLITQEDIDGAVENLANKLVTFSMVKDVIDKRIPGILAAAKAVSSKNSPTLSPRSMQIAAALHRSRGSEL